MWDFIRATLFLTMLLAAGSAVNAQVSLGVVISAPPPLPAVVFTPARPEPQSVWVEGYWYPAANHYKWHEGYWTRPPYEGAQWVAPRHDGQRYYAGYWDGDHGRVEHDHHSDKKHDRDYHDHRRNDDHNQDHNK